MLHHWPEHDQVSGVPWGVMLLLGCRGRHRRTEQGLLINRPLLRGCRGGRLPGVATCNGLFRLSSSLTCVLALLPTPFLGDLVAAAPTAC